MTKRYLILIVTTLFVSHSLCATDIFGFLKKNKLDKKGERHGKWIFYWDDAHKQVESRGHFKHGLAAGRWKYYFNSGKKSKKEKYSRDRKIIYTKTYHPNGKLQYSGQAFLINNNGENLHYYWTGNWKYYSEEGKYQKTEVYEMGKVKSTLIE